MGTEAGLEDVSVGTIQHTVGWLDYFKCVACTGKWANRNLATQRVNYATMMLDRYPEPEDWWDVHFSDEVHFSLGPTCKLMIIRKPGE